MKSFYKLLFFLFSLNVFGQTQVICNYDFQTDTNNWNTYGDTQVTWISQGANTPGAAQVDVLSDDGNIAHRRFYSIYHGFSGYDNKMLLVKVYAKSPTLSSLRIKAELHNNGQFRSIRYDYTLTDNYEKYILPVRIKPGDTDLRINLQIGTTSGTYYFDDISFEYYPYEESEIQQFENQVSKEFQYTPTAIQQSVNNNSANIQIEIDTSQVIAPVLATQIGVNSNFRSGNSLVNRSHLYEQFGSFRFPAGSGSDIYFWDGNVPSNISGYSGTDSKFLDPEHFIQFKETSIGEASVVVNYAYARMGETPSGTREDRVSQAAAYAAGFVQKLNIDLNGNAKYWEVGNESYGPWESGYNVNGSIITGKEYGEDFKVYVDSMKTIDTNIKIGAVMSHNRYYWNKDVLKEVEDKADYLILHHYLSNIETAEGAKNAIQTLEDDVMELLFFAKEYTSKPFGYFPINLTEYNSQGYHTTTMANGLFITNVIATIIKSRINLSTIWVNEWNINNDETHGLLAINDTNQADYTARPSYIPFYYFPKYFGSKMVQTNVNGDDELFAYASTFDTGETGIVITNFSSSPKDFNINFSNTNNNYDCAFWFEIYADNIDKGNTKFYVNSETSSTSGGGPIDLNSVPPFRSEYQSNNTFTARPYSINFITIGKLPATKITSQPSSLNLCEGEDATFHIESSGQNISYQWQKDGNSIQGATQADYLIQNVSNIDAGDYTCIVTGDFGTITSDIASLSISKATEITEQPQDKNVCENSTVNISLLATGNNLSYQWQKDGNDIQGATLPTYSISNTSLSDNGNYTCIVSGDCGNVISKTATLTIDPETKIISQPTDLTVNEGETATFSVEAVGSNLSYQWQFNNQNITGATNNTYTINNIQTNNAGTYKVIISGNCGTIMSDEAELNIQLSIAELEKAGIKIFPNPAKEKINIIIDNFANTTINLFDITGKKVFSKNIYKQKNQINIEKLTKGMYLMQIKKDKIKLNTMIIKK